MAPMITIRKRKVLDCKRLTDYIGPGVLRELDLDE